MNSIFQKRNCLTQREMRQYLSGELSDEQRYDVENHLLECELCSAAVDGYTQAPDLQSMEEDIRMIRSNITASVQEPPPRYLPWINRAAAVGLILILSYAGFRYWSASQAERAFAAFFEPTPNTYITYRSPDAPDAPIPAELARALEYYDGEAYEQSLPHFKNHLERDPDDLRAILLAANACLLSGRAEQAEQYLLQLQEKGETFQGQTGWYLALAYLRQGKKARARKILERIAATPASPFREKAQAALQQLK
ncbi:MAG: tetratricopeptide repeat protein [Phaeodactylibacter sp.]|nr:tetratricopeptide repeat protein [Phaeodactylibacter sp.]MCB9053007.1 tetratricopeptide repeat protein [Lewinellaceae bacterium]